MPNKAQMKSPIWDALNAHKVEIETRSICDLFKADDQRFNKFHAQIDGLLFDYSKHKIDDKTLQLLCDLARDCGVEKTRDDMFSGGAVNTSEGRAVLHGALRGSVQDDLNVDGENVADFVANALAQIESISEAIRADKTITDVVSIGIGGSDLGPSMACGALSDFADGPRSHFISNIDGHKLSEILGTLKPANTAFIIASKTFTTLETMANAYKARDWISTAMGDDQTGAHFYAITTNEAGAQDFGIAANHILPMREWIGGRYSVWGGVGLSIAVSIGFKGFQEFLNGAKAADMHFIDAPLERNIPVLMAMLGVWYRNVFDYGAHAVLPYAQRLSQFPAFIQQLDMESSGKSVDRNGEAVGYSTGPVVFGGAGTNAQHAFFQLLHQGTQIVPADFIAIINPNHDLKNHHNALLANALAQSQALMQGDHNADEPHRNFEGNRPNSMVMLDRLDPYHLGLLMAIYEHKVFVQGVIWNINSFDQWGVELGKKLAATATKALEDGHMSDTLDPSSRALVDYIRAKSSP